MRGGGGSSSGSGSDGGGSGGAAKWQLFTASSRRHPRRSFQNTGHAVTQKMGSLLLPGRRSFIFEDRHKQTNGTRGNPLVHCTGLEKMARERKGDRT